MPSKKDNAIMRAESAFRRFQPSSTANSDARAWYACARKDFDRLLDSLTADKILTLKSLLDCLADCKISESKAVREGRTIHLSNVEAEHAPEFSICVMYTKTEGPAVLDKAIALDNIIIPPNES